MQPSAAACTICFTAWQNWLLSKARALVVAARAALIPIATGNNGDNLSAVVNGQWFVMRVPYPIGYFAKGMDELYDLQADPGEMKNLYGNAKYREVRDQLEQRLLAWQKSINDPILTMKK